MIDKTYPVSLIQSIVASDLALNADQDYKINFLAIDSRNIRSYANTLFIAIKGDRFDGHDYVQALIVKGVKNFIVHRSYAGTPDDTVNLIRVNDTLDSLQKLGAYQRNKFSYPLIAVTGSNGKTTIKEWLYQLLFSDKRVVRNPKSYNSQVGVPLSLWAMDSSYDLGLFEAGISEPGEMSKLQQIIKPTIGILSNVGSAHSENFVSIAEQISEKLRLFDSVQTLIYCTDHVEVNQQISIRNIKTFSWGKDSSSNVKVITVEHIGKATKIALQTKDEKGSIRFPLMDKGSIENVMHCVTALLYLGYSIDDIDKKLADLRPIEMRLEYKNAINNCILINDAYNSDFGSLEIALNHIHQQYPNRKYSLVLSDILQSNKDTEQLYKNVGKLVETYNISRVIGVGPNISEHKAAFTGTQNIFFNKTQDLLDNRATIVFENEVVLLKGARRFKFEKIAKELEEKTHDTVLEVDLNAIQSNFNFWKTKLHPSTKIMVMIKAYAYGTSGYELARILEHNRVQYLAVAYADEGVELRRKGISTPIMVMNPELRSIDILIKYRLEPEIYSFSFLQAFSNVLKMSMHKQDDYYPVHIKVDTGMRRLGFEPNEIRQLCKELSQMNWIKVNSVFSHLVESENIQQQDFTFSQIEVFNTAARLLEQAIGYSVIKHVLNTEGILNYPQAQMDMVRLGIGLHGIVGNHEISESLTPVSRLKTTISQIKQIAKNETVGYGRAYIAVKDMTIATVGIGYADGLKRSLGNGNGCMIVHGQRAKIIGNVCMDMCMLDVTGIEVYAGDDVIVFGKELSINEVAKQAGTIPYDILTGISSRVERIFYQE